MLKQLKHAGLAHSEYTLQKESSNRSGSYKLCKKRKKAGSGERQHEANNVKEELLLAGSSHTSGCEVCSTGHPPGQRQSPALTFYSFS